MVNNHNWKLTKKYLEYRLSVDQITKGSMLREQTHLRYLLQWAQETSFKQASTIRPTFPEYLLSNRLDDEARSLSAVYIKKVLATARTFFTWLSDNEAGYKHIKQSWVKKIKAKRLSNISQKSEYVTFEEISIIASRSVQTVQERRTRAALVFLFLSGMRIGAFVSLPIQAVDISNGLVNQFPNLGVRTKNGKHATTFLLDIPELLKVVQDWDNEVRSILPPDAPWFAPLSSVTGQIETKNIELGEHRESLARRGFKLWLQKENLLYHSPHKYRHGHIHYGLAHAKTIEDFKAISLNAMHASMEITDQFYSVMQDAEVQNRITALSKNAISQDQSELVKTLEALLSTMKKGKA